MALATPVALLPSVGMPLLVPSSKRLLPECNLTPVPLVLLVSPTHMPITHAQNHDQTSVKILSSLSSFVPEKSDKNVMKLETEFERVLLLLLLWL